MKYCLYAFRLHRYAITVGIEPTKKCRFRALRPAVKWVAFPILAFVITTDVFFVGAQINTLRYI